MSETDPGVSEQRVGDGEVEGEATHRFRRGVDVEEGMHRQDAEVTMEALDRLYRNLANSL